MDGIKDLLLSPETESGEPGSGLEELFDVLPAENKGQIQLFLRELRSSGKVYSVGATKGARWYPGSR